VARAKRRRDSRLRQSGGAPSVSKINPGMAAVTCGCDLRHCGPLGITAVWRAVEKLTGSAAGLREMSGRAMTIDSFKITPSRIGSTMAASAAMRAPYGLESIGDCLTCTHREGRLFCHLSPPAVQRAFRLIGAFEVSVRLKAACKRSLPRRLCCRSHCISRLEDRDKVGEYGRRFLS